MRVRIAITILAGAALFVLAFALEASAQDASRDEAAIKEVLETAYVEGLHVLRDEAAIRNGFHPDFIMSVNDGEGVILVPLDKWLERLELDGQRNPKQVEGRFAFVDVTGEAASAKLQIYEDGQHLSRLTGQSQGIRPAGEGNRGPLSSNRSRSTASDFEKEDHDARGAKER